MLAKRFNKIINIIGLHEQAGFTSGCSCVDATAALKITLQNLTCAGHEAYVLFVDIIKAFDSVNRDMLWKILAKYGIPENMIQTIKKMYTDIHVTLQVSKEKEEFMSTSGVKQGDNLAPLLFLFVIQAAIEMMQESWPTKLPDLQYSPNEWDPKTGTLKQPSSLTH